jgi:hypothetical protein
MHTRDLHVPNGQVIPTPTRLGAEMCSSVRHVLNEQVRPAPMRPGAKMCLSLNFSDAVHVPGSMVLPCIERIMGDKHAAHPYATSDGGLRRVYFGINFNLYPDEPAG